MRLIAERAYMYVMEDGKPLAERVIRVYREYGRLVGDNVVCVYTHSPVTVVLVNGTAPMHPGAMFSVSWMSPSHAAYEINSMLAAVHLEYRMRPATEQEAQDIGLSVAALKPFLSPPAPEPTDIPR